jgi:hypothetical protein
MLCLPAKTQCLAAMQLEAASNAALSAPMFDLDVEAFVVASDLNMSQTSSLDLAFFSVHDRALTDAEVSTMDIVARVTSSTCPVLAVGVTLWCSMHSLLAKSVLVSLQPCPLSMERHDVLMQIVCVVPAVIKLHHRSVSSAMATYGRHWNSAPFRH